MSLIADAGDLSLPSDLNLLDTSISELTSLLNEGCITSVQLVRAYLINIEKNNIAGRGLRAIIQAAPAESVLRIAQGLDDERQAGHPRGPLHGIPVLIKDNIATAPDLVMSTTAGHTGLRKSTTCGDAEVIQRLRNAGAIIIAKTNMSQFAGYQAARAPNGWSAVGGQTISAYVPGGLPNGDPLGSSSGSAVGLSAGFGAVALGTETCGSIVTPASRAALFAIKPSRGLVSLNGVIPITFDWDTVGPIGFTAGDVALILDAITGADYIYTRAAQESSLKGLRLGIVRNVHFGITNPATHCFGTSVNESLTALLAAGERMQSAGAIIRHVNTGLTSSDIKALDEASDAIMAGTFKQDIEAYMSSLVESPVRTLDDLIQWNKDHADVEMPPQAADQQYLLDALTAPKRGSLEFEAASKLSRDIAGRQGLDRLFDENELDAAVYVMGLGNPQLYASSAGYAMGVAPLGYDGRGAPFGIAFVVRPGQEEKLVGILSGYEAIMPKRKTPTGL